jgi:hypothetical protein
MLFGLPRKGDNVNVAVVLGDEPIPELAQGSSYSVAFRRTGAFFDLSEKG